MGQSSDYPNVPDWTQKPEGYKAGAMVKYQGNVFKAAFGASEPGKDDPDHNGWRLFDELYDLTKPPPASQAAVVAYLPTWISDLDTSNPAIYQNITHALVAFLMFSETTPGAFDPQATQAVASLLATVVPRGHASGTKIGISIGGATDYGFLALMQRAGANPNDSAVTQAVANVAQFVKAHGLDHVDLDLECWWDRNGDPTKDQGGRKSSAGPHPAGLGLTAFAKQLKQALPGLTLSATLFATSWYGNNYDAKLAEQVDWLGVMTYDLTGSWNASPVGPHTALTVIRQQEVYEAEQQGTWPGNGATNNPILSVEDSLWYWTNPFYTNWQGVGQKLPRNKILFGVPLYGYDFAYAKGPDAQSGQTPPGYKVLRYKDILSRFGGGAANANIKVAGSTPRPSFVVAAGNYPYANNIYFETADSAAAKLSFAKTVGAGGVIVWELSSDVLDAAGTSILGALYRKSGNPSQRPPIPGKLGTIRTITFNKVINDFDPLGFSLTPGQKTIFLIHGWNSDPSVFNVASALQQSRYQDADIISVDWSTFARNLNYLYVQGKVPVVAQCLFNVMKTLGITPNDTKVIGHSLGAHIAGYASNNYRQDTNKSIGEIVGLDPAAPFWVEYNSNMSSGLDSTHAERVVVIHSSNSVFGLVGAPQGGFGNYGNIGTLDIFIKKGKKIYGADGSSPNDHGLATDVYKSLLQTGAHYPGVNTFAIHKQTRIVPNPQGEPLIIEEDAAWADREFTETFDLLRLDDATLKGQYTIDYGNDN